MISPLPPRSYSFTESEIESHRPLKIDKENASLRPLLRKYNNVEESVRTLKMHDVNYQIIAEDPPSKVSYLSKLTLRRTIRSNKGWIARRPQRPSMSSRSTATSTSTQVARTLAHTTKRPRSRWNQPLTPYRLTSIPSAKSMRPQSDCSSAKLRSKNSILRSPNRSTNVIIPSRSSQNLESSVKKTNARRTLTNSLNSILSRDSRRKLSSRQRRSRRQPRRRSIFQRR